MSSLVRFRYLAAVVALGVMTMSPLAHAAEKLKGFYSGSGGISQEAHRVVNGGVSVHGQLLIPVRWLGLRWSVILKNEQKMLVLV